MLERKVHFFKSEFLWINNGNLVPVNNPVGIFTQISTLPFQRANPSRYLEIEDGHDLLLIPDEITAEQIRGKFGMARRTALPEVEEAGQFNPVGNLISANAGIFEGGHFILFRDRNVLGMEFSQFAPKTGRLSEYLQTKASDLVNSANFYPILRGDVAETIRTIGEVAAISLKVSRAGLNTVRPLDDTLGDIFERASVLNDGIDSFELVLRKKAHARSGFDFLFQVERLADWLGAPGVRETVQRFRVKAKPAEPIQAQDNRDRWFDLLEDKFIVSKQVRPGGDRSRSVDSISMYNAIVEAYDEVRPAVIE